MLTILLPAKLSPKVCKLASFHSPKISKVGRIKGRYRYQELLLKSSVEGGIGIPSHRQTQNLHSDH